MSIIYTHPHTHYTITLLKSMPLLWLPTIQCYVSPSHHLALSITSSAIMPSHIQCQSEMAFLGSYFFLYEGMRDGILRSASSSSSSGTHQEVIAVPIAGGLSGAASWWISFPLDCVRAGVQGQKLPPPKDDGGAWRILLSLLRQRGFRSLYSGASASVARAFLVSGSRFSAYEGALWMLRGGRNNK